MRKRITRTLLLAGLLGVAGSAQAVLYEILEVRTGSSGFGASLFHDASTGNHMSGTVLGDITGGLAGGPYGLFNDSTGFFDATFNLSGAASGTVTMQGNLYFDPGTGLMDIGPGGTRSNLTMTFSSTDLSGGDPALFFKPGYQCCGSTGFDPNTFLPSTTPAGMILTIWGANGWDALTNDYTAQTSLGMDLRLLLTPKPEPPGTGVPEPATAALIALGIAGFRLRRARAA